MALAVTNIVVNVSVSLNIDIIFAPISSGAKVAYAALLVYTKDGKVKVLQATLAHRLRLSVRTIGRYMKELITGGFVAPIEEPMPGQARGYAVGEEKPEVKPEVKTEIKPVIQPVIKPEIKREVPPPVVTEKREPLLDAMSEAVLEEALKEPPPQNRTGLPPSLEKYFTFLTMQNKPGFSAVAAEIFRRYLIGMRKKAAANLLINAKSQDTSSARYQSR